MEDWLEAQRRQDAERKARRERDDLEYDKEQAERAAARAEREAIEARRQVQRERAAAQEEAEQYAEAARAAAREEMHQRKAVGKFAAALRAIVNAWDQIVPEGETPSNVPPLDLSECIEAARKLLDPPPPVDD